MEVIEVVLIILGIIVFIVSFLLPTGKTGAAQENAQISDEEIHKMLEKEVAGVREQISEIADETVTYSMEKTERSLERITNEKMLAINEYSDTVLSEINKNHKEVVFLYDMLNDKHENLVSTVSEASKTAGEIRQTVQDAEVTAREASEKVREVQESMSEVVSLAQNKIEKMQEAAGEPVIPAVNYERTDDEAPFRPIVVQKVDVLGQPEDMAVLGGESPAESGEAFAPMEESKKKKARAPRAVRKERKEAEDASGRIFAASSEVPDIAMTHTGGENGKNNNERILELHRAGKSNMAIARELGLGIGEVKLVIDLFERV
ncbi:MAG: DUF6115 domain-containing protein [Clostridium sp.]|nr:DUF6115 domain-containing protein [Clostridium sp.]